MQRHQHLIIVLSILGTLAWSGFFLLGRSNFLESSSSSDLSDNDDDHRRSLRISDFIDPKSLDQKIITPPGDETSKLLPVCTVENVGLGRWTYEHSNAIVKGFSFQEAIVSTAKWTPLRCSLPELDWRPEAVRSCFAEKRIRNLVIMGGSTSTYIANDFLDWMLDRNDRANLHHKKRIGGVVDSELSFHGITMTKATSLKHQSFLDNSKFFEDTLVLFNSGLWDMRGNDLDKYAQNVEGLANAFSRYKKEHPSNHVIWRSTGTPNWERLDMKMDRARARERLLNPDAVLVYNAVASESMQSHGIEVFDDAAMVMGRPEEIRGPDDGLHPSSSLNVELMKILLSVLCQ